MSVPAKRRTSSQGKRRASHFALKSKTLSECAKCKTKVRPHRACPKCGEYKKATKAEKSTK
ncbi:50S ribosomal protein L32 [Patescibacteria group bacterium]|nr:50S ribosomal protein L32 [Patescibacteria group bacterium]